MTRSICIAAAAVAGAATLSNAAISLTILENQVTKGTASTLTVYATATAGEQVQGFELRPKINDGGISDTYPSFSALPPVAGTIFSPSTSVSDSGGPISTYPLYPFISFNGSDPVVATGVVGKLILDTTSVPNGGTFTVDLTEIDNDLIFTSYFTGTSSRIDLTDSGPFTIQVVVPEPATIGALAAGVGLLAMRRRRRA